VLHEAWVVVCSSLVAAKIRHMPPRGTEVLVDDRRLDAAGIEMLPSGSPHCSTGMATRARLRFAAAA